MGGPVIWLWTGLGVLVLLLVVVLWGARTLRQSTRIAREAIGQVELGQIGALRDECQRIFKSAFGETLTLEDLEQSGRLLSDRLDNPLALKEECRKDGFYWYFVLPCGAYLGELLRVHAKAQWKEAGDAGPMMIIPLPDGEAEVYPFDKIIKQCTTGDKGDIWAYLYTATRLQQVVTQAFSNDSPGGARIQET